MQVIGGSSKRVNYFRLPISQTDGVGSQRISSKCQQTNYSVLAIRCHHVLTSTKSIIVEYSLDSPHSPRNMASTTDIAALNNLPNWVPRSMSFSMNGTYAAVVAENLAVDKNASGLSKESVVVFLYNLNKSDSVYRVLTNQDLFCNTSLNLNPRTQITFYWDWDNQVERLGIGAGSTTITRFEVNELSLTVTNSQNMLTDDSLVLSMVDGTSKNLAISDIFGGLSSGKSHWWVYFLIIMLILGGLIIAAFIKWRWFNKENTDDYQGADQEQASVHSEEPMLKSGYGTLPLNRPGDSVQTEDKLLNKIEAKDDQEA